MRRNALQEICARYPYQKLAEKLPKKDFQMMLDWLDAHDELGHLEFEYAINRMFLDDKEWKPQLKTQTTIQWLLTSANSRVHTKGR